MSDMMGQNTLVSPVGASPDGSVASTATPGASGPGGQMAMASALLWLIGGAAALSVGIAVAGRKGVKPTFGRLDVFDAMWNTATVVVFIGAGKLIAYKFHGHKLSQAFLLVV